MHQFIMGGAGGGTGGAAQSVRGIYTSFKGMNVTYRIYMIILHRFSCLFSAGGCLWWGDVLKVRRYIYSGINKEDTINRPVASTTAVVVITSQYPQGIIRLELTLNAFTTGNPFLETNLLGFRIGTGFRALLRLMRVRCSFAGYMYSDANKEDPGIMAITTAIKITTHTEKYM